MKTTKRIEERVVIGSGALGNQIELSVEYAEGERPEAVHIRIDGTGKVMSVEEVLRIAQTIGEMYWAPSGSMCADHGVYDGKPNGYACPKCKTEQAAAREVSA